MTNRGELKAELTAIRVKLKKGGIMLKLTITIKDKKDEENCTVTITPQKDQSKATDNEKHCLAIVYGSINKALGEIGK